MTGFPTGPGVRVALIVAGIVVALCLLGGVLLIVAALVLR